MRRIMLVLVMLTGLLATGTVILPQRASAAVSSACDNSNILNFPTWYKYLDVGEEKQIVGGTEKVIDDCAIIGPVNTEGEHAGELNTQAVVGRVSLAVIEILLRIAALVSVAFVIKGGFNYITSQGEPENTKSARQTITNSLIGLVISLVATGAVAFIANTLTK